MVTAILVCATLFQFHTDTVKASEVVQRIAEADRETQARTEAAKAAEERRRFEESFNGLVAALDDFQREYNASRGNVWPRKKAEALKKALKDFKLR